MKLQVKVTVWQEIELNEKEGVSQEEVIDLLKTFGPSQLWDDEQERFAPEWKNLVETEEYISVEENGGCSTMELYDDNHNLLWEDSNYKNEIL